MRLTDRRAYRQPIDLERKLCQEFGMFPLSLMYNTGNQLGLSGFFLSAILASLGGRAPFLRLQLAQQQTIFCQDVLPPWLRRIT